MHNIYFYFYIPYNMLTTNNLLSICPHTVDPLYLHQPSLSSPPLPNHYSWSLQGGFGIKNRRLKPCS